VGLQDGTTLQEKAERYSRHLIIAIMPKTKGLLKPSLMSTQDSAASEDMIKNISTSTNPAGAAVDAGTKALKWIVGNNVEQNKLRTAKVQADMFNRPAPAELLHEQTFSYTPRPFRVVPENPRKEHEFAAANERRRLEYLRNTQFRNWDNWKRNTIDIEDPAPIVDKKEQAENARQIVIGKRILSGGGLINKK
jgi:hypothetical protein